MCTDGVMKNESSRQGEHLEDEEKTREEETICLS